MQGDYQNIMFYKPWYTKYMDFIQGLDNAWHTDFKVNYLNGLHVKSMVPLSNLNEIFLLTPSWSLRR